MNVRHNLAVLVAGNYAVIYVYLAHFIPLLRLMAFPPLFRNKTRTPSLERKKARSPMKVGGLSIAITFGLNPTDCFHSMIRAQTLQPQYHNQQRRVRPSRLASKYLASLIRSLKWAIVYLTNHRDLVDFDRFSGRAAIFLILNPPKFIGLMAYSLSEARPE